MMGRMMASAAPSATSSELSTLRALARLMDPEAGLDDHGADAARSGRR